VPTMRKNTASKSPKRVVHKMEVESRGEAQERHSPSPAAQKERRTTDLAVTQKQ
jgi:hypothetical protein